MPRRKQYGRPVSNPANLSEHAGKQLSALDQLGQYYGGWRMEAEAVPSALRAGADNDEWLLNNATASPSTESRRLPATTGQHFPRIEAGAYGEPVTMSPLTAGQLSSVDRWAESQGLALDSEEANRARRALYEQQINAALAPREQGLRPLPQAASGLTGQQIDNVLMAMRRNLRQPPYGGVYQYAPLGIDEARQRLGDAFARTAAKGLGQFDAQTGASIPVLRKMAESSPQMREFYARRLMEVLSLGGVMAGIGASQGQSTPTMTTDYTTGPLSGLY